MKHDKTFYDVIVMQYFSISANINWNEMTSVEQTAYKTFLTELLIAFDNNAIITDNSQYYGFLKEVTENIWNPLMHQNIFKYINDLTEKVDELTKISARPVIINTTDADLIPYG